MAISFNDQRKTGTLVVDALNLAFRWKHQGRSDFRYDYIKTVQSFADSYKCKDIIITADGGASSYRKGYPILTIKGTERRSTQPKRKKKKLRLKSSLTSTRATLDIIEWPVLQYAGVEADDVAAHLVKNKEEFGFETMWLISSDRDWDLLIQEGVNRFSYVNRKEVTIDNWYDHYEVTPEEFISLKCLTGDKGDNVPGIPGIGPKRAYGLIKEYGDAFSIYDAAPIAGKYKYIESLNENYEQILQNYELMDLITYCDEAIGKNNVAEIKERFAC